MDRIDLHLPVNDVEHSKLLDKRSGPGQSQQIKQGVQSAYALQHRRLGTARFNNSMSNKEIRELAQLSASAKDLLDTAAEKLDISSARSYVRAVKVARTIADLDASQEILPAHIGEALQYRYQAAAAVLPAYAY